MLKPLLTVSYTDGKFCEPSACGSCSGDTGVELSIEVVISVVCLDHPLVLGLWNSNSI